MSVLGSGGVAGVAPVVGFPASNEERTTILKTFSKGRTIAEKALKHPLRVFPYSNTPPPPGSSHQGF